MRGSTLAELCLAHCLEHGSLQNGLVKVMATPLAGGLVDVESCRREDSLPRPFSPGVGVFAGQRPWQLDPSAAKRHVAIVQSLHAR